jgi:hypothetical protein
MMVARVGKGGSRSRLMLFNGWQQFAQGIG